MELSKQVCTLEQAKRLKELGVSQDSYFSWCGEEGQRLMDNGRDGLAIQQWVYVANTVPINNMQADHRDDVPSAKPFAAAYTVAELGEMIPETQAEKMFSSHYNDHLGCWMCDYYGFKTEQEFEDWDSSTIPPLIHQTEADTEAEARAEMLLYLIESKSVTIEEINKRLQH